MYRFVALIWNPEDGRRGANARAFAERLRSSAIDWHCVMKRNGLYVFHAGALEGATEAYYLTESAGVVVGKLFPCTGSNAATPAAVAFDKATSQTIIDTQAKHLVDDYWGRYVAFLWDEAKQRHYVFRDPTGGLPCIFTNAGGVSVFMSDLEDYVPLAAGECTVNWNYIAALFWHMRQVTRSTGFNEVSKLHAGECMVVENGSMVGAFHWEPTRVYAAGPILEDLTRARARLRSAIENSVTTWASCYDSIILELSGGLDSSILASCLSGMHIEKDVVCVNFCTETQEGNERYFAHLAAQRAGLELVEGDWRTTDHALEAMLDTGTHDTPIGTTGETERVLQRLTRERGATVVFTGNGGDHLYQQRRNPLSAADYVWQRGLRPQLATIVADISRLTGKSVWNILGGVFTHGLLKRNIDPYSAFEQSVLLTEEIRAGFPPGALAHPWVENATNQKLPPGKVQQIFDLVDSQHFYLRPYRFVDTLHPLISQPVIECCLQIPTYVLTHGGVDRALAREAFRDELPPEIATRTTKGGTTGYFTRLTVENARFIREFLLDGILISAGILDKQKLEMELSEEMLIRGKRLFDVFTALRTEAWLRSWARVWRKAAA